MTATPDIMGEPSQNCTVIIPAFDTHPNISARHEAAIAEAMHRLDKVRLRERRHPPAVDRGKNPEKTEAHKRAVQSRNRAQRLLDIADLQMPVTRRSISEALSIEDSSAGDRIQAMMRDGYIKAVRRKDGTAIRPGRASQYVLTEAGKAELARLQAGKAT